MGYATRLGNEFSLRLQTAIGIRQCALGGGSAQRLVLVLAVDIDQKIAGLTQLRGRSGMTVDETARTAGGFNHAPQQADAFVAGQITVAEPGRQRAMTVHFEFGSDVGTGRALTDGDRVRAFAQREREWATQGLSKAKKKPDDNDKNIKSFKINQSEQLAGKAARTEKAMERLEVVEEPREAWQLRLTFGETARSGDVVVLPRPERGRGCAGRRRAPAAVRTRWTRGSSWPRTGATARRPAGRAVRAGAAPHCCRGQGRLTRCGPGRAGAARGRALTARGAFVFFHRTIS